MRQCTQIIVCKTRQACYFGDKIGGGVALCVNNNISYGRRNDLEKR